MSKQLRLVDPLPEPKAPARRARVTKQAKGRPVRWHTEWRLDDRTRQVGQHGVAAARAALARARRPEEPLAEAS